MDELAVLVSVAPWQVEIERLGDLLEGIWHWEPKVRTILLIDDATEPRNLHEQFSVPAGVRIHSIAHPRRGRGLGGWGGLSEGILTGLQWLVRHEPASMILKIDTDAMVIGSFADKARNYFESHARVGAIGLLDEHCSGKPRNYVPCDRIMRRRTHVIGLYPHHPWSRKIELQFIGRAGVERRRFLRARTHGYRWGQHCQGGAYILRGAAVEQLDREQFLDEPSFWRTAYIGEDMLVSAYIKAAGWDLAGAAKPGEIFGIENRGLPMSPADLHSKGYSIIHAVKNDAHHSEAQIRSFFSALRSH